VLEGGCGDGRVVGAQTLELALSLLSVMLEIVMLQKSLSAMAQIEMFSPWFRDLPSLYLVCPYKSQ
jgi:hypothetical protein